VGKDVLDQPINGIEPYEAIAYKGLERAVHPQFELFARRQGVDLHQPVWTVVEAAQAELPTFEADMQALCDYAA
jgi:hypothetical protein